tara:strand:- start:684 stop:935 length:252 start_codon:yes stop_codon:yes gene_type:complete
MTLEYIKANPQVNVVTRRVMTRTLILTKTQVEGIIRLWAREHAGFVDPEIETTCMYANTFTGAILTEQTIQLYDDSDTPIEGE